MSLQDLLAELKKEYLQSITEKISVIDNLWKTQNLLDLETEFHKMKGTGSTYGIPEISQLGEILESLCEARSPSLAQAIPPTLRILQRIQHKRHEGDSFSLEDDPEFQLIQRLSRGF